MKYCTTQLVYNIQLLLPRLRELVLIGIPDPVAVGTTRQRKVINAQ